MSSAAHEMPRRVEAEWLDTLPHDDARAQHSRRDLHLVNALMDNAAIVAGELRAGLPQRPVCIAEIGAGDGRFALRVASRLDMSGHLILLDRQAPGPDTHLLAPHGWTTEMVADDVFSWLRDPATARFDAIYANLFLHHFEPEPLSELLRLAAARTNLFIACEPRRSRPALVSTKLLGLAGCNDVTLHDAAVSVIAGFRGRELSALWPAGPGWYLEERSRGLFSHGFVAERA